VTKFMRSANCTEAVTDIAGIFVVDNVQWSFDNFRMINSQSTVTTMTYDNANELLSARKDNGTISFGYDAYGRTRFRVWGLSIIFHVLFDYLGGYEGSTPPRIVV